MMQIFKSVAEATTEDQEALLRESESQDFSDAHKHRRKFSAWLPTILWMITAIAAFVGGTTAGRSILWDWDRSCTRHVVQGSPLLQDLAITYETITFNGTFLNENIYRQKASPDVDAAWEALGVNYRSVAIPEERASDAGLRSDQVKISQRYGGGYPANVEGLHQLHCLNLLRQALYYNFEYYYAQKEGAFKNEDHILKLHVSHCLDILRQQLMCTIDIGFLGQVWYNPFSDGVR